MWPDCSPPSDESARLHRGDDVPVADGRLDDVDARVAQRAAQPEVRHHRDDDSRCRRAAPRACRSSAVIVMIWSPSTSSPRLVDREHAIAVAVEREPERRAVLDDRALQRLGMGRPARVVDVAAVGLGVHARARRRPPSRNTRGPTSNAAPFAQSSTTCETVERCALRARSTQVLRRSRPRHRSWVAPRRRRGRARRRRATSSSASIAASASSASLRPSAPITFTPLSVHGLWLAETIAAGTPSRAAANAIAGVGSTPSETGVDAFATAARPRARARSAGPTRACRGR